MGYAVVHLEKAKGSDSGMSAHIERKIHPANADETRTSLNRELIQFPEGVLDRTHAIAHRLSTAGLKRKIGNNQVKAIRVLLTGSHDDMMRIEREGKLGEWARDNVDWLKATFGAENVVSAVLHMDEKTPPFMPPLSPSCMERDVRLQPSGRRDRKIQTSQRRSIGRKLQRSPASVLMT